MYLLHLVIPQTLPGSDLDTGTAYLLHTCKILNVMLVNLDFPSLYYFLFNLLDDSNYHRHREDVIGEEKLCLDFLRGS